ncbi:MAG TPA: DUF4198 domain-containing protein [Acidobacteriota bacterium]
MHIAVVALLAAGLTVARSVAAHDLRLTPDRYRPAAGQTVLLRLWSGDHLIREEAVPFLPDKILAFDQYGPTGHQNLLDRMLASSRPLHPWRSDQPGTYVLTMERGFSFLSLPPDKFEHYLEFEEGLLDMLELRRAKGERDQPSRERYTRSLKTILQVGPAEPGGAATQALGQRLEIVPEVHPGTLATGARLPLRVLFEGEPLPGRLVRCMVRTAAELEVQEARTDADGRCSFVLRAAGETLIRLVHMRRADPASAAEWESFWGALTFELPSEGGASR